MPQSNSNRSHHDTQSNCNGAGRRRRDLLEVKSKLDAEFRRFSLDRTKVTTFDSFYKLLETFHQMQDIPFKIFYEDPSHGDLLPINNDENYAKAVSLAKPFLRIILQRKGEGWEHLSGMNRGSKKNGFFGIGNILPVMSPTKHRLSIGQPENFRQVAQIMDVDILPETCRRVRLVKHGSDKPLGFYIRDGNSVRVTPQGLVKNQGIFISKLVAGGLAEGTGLLAQNDEVLEVNGIDVAGKTLDQVTDMMVANAANLIITIRPAAQRSLPLHLPHHLPASSSMPTGFSNPNFPSSSKTSVLRSSQGSKDSRNSRDSSNNSDDEEDEVKDHLSPPSVPPPPPPPEPETSKNNNHRHHKNHSKHLQGNHHLEASSSSSEVKRTHHPSSRENGKRESLESTLEEDEDLDDSRFEEVVTL